MDEEGSCNAQRDLTSLLFGVIGLLAPFLFVLLLYSSTHGWNR